MRAVVQRVSFAQVTVATEVVGRIEQGICVFVGMAAQDAEADATALAEKLVNLRIFEDAAGKMNCSVRDVKGAMLLISQFTLFGDVRRGNRPSFSAAMPPESAKQLFEYFCNVCRKLDVPIQTGVFRAEMRVELANEGPVTIMIDTNKEF